MREPIKQAIFLGKMELYSDEKLYHIGSTVIQGARTVLDCEDRMQDEGVGVAGAAIYPGKQAETRVGTVDPGYTPGYTGIPFVSDPPPDRIGARLAAIVLY
jgi:hypothetical protein